MTSTTSEAATALIPGAQLVFDALRTGKPLTNREAINRLGVGSLSRRVIEINEWLAATGSHLVIRVERRQEDRGERYRTYWLDAKDVDEETGTVTLTIDGAERVFMRYVAPNEDRRADAFTGSAGRRVAKAGELTERDLAESAALFAPPEIACTIERPVDGFRYSLPGIFPAESSMHSNRDWARLVAWWKRPVEEGGAGMWVSDVDEADAQYWRWCDRHFDRERRKARRLACSLHG